jgi:predicted ester cyclase/GNAT superfamily N-acetyltransferase
MHPIVSEEDNVADVAAQLESRITRFNEDRVGPIRMRPVALTVRDDRRQLIAGLTGECFWNSLYVDLLWVDDEYRRQRYGASLLRRAEELAIEHACGSVYLSTFDFQAPAFYAKHGYSVIGELANVPPGSKRQWFCKWLGPAPDQDKDLVRRWIAFAEAGFRGDFGEFIAADYVGHLGDRVMDRGELERAELAFLGAFPDTRHTIEDLVAVDDRVVIRLTMRATHEAEFYGIPRTGRRVEFTALVMYRIRDGKIAESWGEIDFLRLMRQLRA